MNMKLSSTQDNTAKKVLVFRILVFTSLVVTSIIFGTLTFLILEAAELRNYKAQYDSIADQVENIVEASIRTTSAAGEELAVMAGLTHKNASNWPYASILGFQDLSIKLRTMVQVQVTILLPIVQPDELSSFEAYAQQTFLEDPSFPPGSGFTPGIGFHVYKFQDRVTRVRDTTGETPFSPFNILTPFLNIFPVETQGRLLLYNLHSEPLTGSVMDSIIDCVKKENATIRSSTTCSAITDLTLSPTASGILQPVSFLYFPIYPYLEPGKLVGFVGLVYTWLSILNNAVPDYVTGIDCVLCSPTACYTYTITDGVPELKGEGDLHDPDYSERARSVRFGLDSAATGSVEFEIFIYPSEDFYNIYNTNLPIYCSVGAVLLIILTSFIFMGYDLFVKADARATKAVLESKKQFVRYISHEIRTPLNTVNVGLNVLEDFVNDLPQETERQMDDVKELQSLTSEIKAGAETAVMVVNDFLQYDKVESNSLSIDLSPLVPVEFLKKAVSMFDIQGKGNEIRLNLIFNGLYDPESDEIAHPELRILADRNRMAQVVRNLVSNALKFSPTGSEVIVSCSWKPDGLPDYKQNNTDFQSYEVVGSLLISVEDSGSGISDENQKKLFGEGVQFNVNELQGGQGSGLGLWISKAIVVLHGGMIWAESEGEGKGSTFFVELPLFKGNSTQVKEQSDRRKSILQITNKIAPISLSSNTDHSNNESCPKPSKILIVDDAPSNRKMLTRLLQLRGYDCDAVEDGIDCVRLIENDKELGTCTYNCILLDFQMVHLNGPETAEKVRKLGFGSDRVKIIGVTGNVMREDVDIFMNKGADFIMQKPFSFDIFQNEMDRKNIE